MELKPIVTTKIIEKEKEQRKLEEELNQMVLEQENQKKEKGKGGKLSEFV